MSEIKVTFLAQNIFGDEDKPMSVDINAIQVIGDRQIMISGNWFKVVEEKEYFLRAKRWFQEKKQEPIKKAKSKKR